MKSTKDIGLKEVQEVYSGPEGDLWELIMGHQIHIGGFTSSMDLAEKAGIGAGILNADGHPQAVHGPSLRCSYRRNNREKYLSLS